MSPAAPTWDRMDPEQRTAAVADLLAEGHAPGTIAFKLKAPKPAIQRLAAIIRQKELHQDTKGKPLGPEDGPEAQARDRAGLPADSRAGDRQPHSASKGRPEGGKRLQVLRGPNHAAEPDENAIANGVTGGESAATNSETTPLPGSNEGAEAQELLPDSGLRTGGRASPLRRSSGVSATHPCSPQAKPGRPRRAGKNSEKPANSSPPAPEAAPPPAVSGILPDAPDPSIPWAMLSARQKQAAVLALRVEGLSANQIQARLQATSRCAVLGVVNRLRAAGHLPPAAGRSKASKLSRPPTPKPAKPSKHLADLPGGKPKTHRYDLKGRAEDRAASQGLAPHLISGEPRRPIVLEVPQSRRLQLVDLNDRVCRWPAGDPQLPDFAFCGAATEAAPYCPYHARIAFVSVADRRAERQQERTA